ncbi:helicase-related protein [Paenarthrobacter sp. NPDC091669]|uniref:helicase-related protein n=1 Tax=Paenarthrobacter sp. NPDC091669 TaxID=3364384 RepID=UPI00380E5BD0
MTVTIALRNLLSKPAEGDRDANCWFQVGLEVETNTHALLDRQGLHDGLADDDDVVTAQLLYRNARMFAAGHGCATTWLEQDVHEGLCRRAETTFVPRQEVPRAMTGDVLANLSFGLLSSASSDQVTAQLSLLVREYRDWIASKSAGLDIQASADEDVPEHLRSKAERHLDAASAAADRIQAGIDLLRDDAIAFRAFQLANEAMHIQRSRQDWVRAKSVEPFVLDGNQSWRPFQIAFILLNLPSLTDTSHGERKVADLLWFPTGGGKTEAYLGLIAYTIILRRLRDPDAKGVAVIMRYTLRLLTIQQFERSAMLICSLEHLRNEVKGLGSEPFSIGLWVGAGATPNNTDVARRNLRKLAQGLDVIEGNPVQLKACPWCGRVLSEADYAVRNLPIQRMLIRCPNDSCEYRSGLPVHLVDSDIYRERPELVIATVDKFAQMAWNGAIASLFGRGTTTDYGPDLVIQDELHLISGPLGSTVGIYETAFDLAASDALRSGAEESTRRPKIIASTATIRRAEKQIYAVFDRQSALFPPPGLRPDDSFFAERAPREEYGTREYVGVMASGTSHATLMVRVYASLLNSGLRIDGTDEDRDPYWTLMGYFNSLRVLGSAYLQVSDDVRVRLGLLASRDGQPDRVREAHPNELTSRVPNNLIPAQLKNLETRFGQDGVENVVLATNMISVGLDVDRLGLMAVMGQPQSSAEYIQATSRVGRKYPGLVVTIFNSSKSRDRSHFEGFVPFHQAMYRAVEATSATPFAARSRDRALHGVLVSAVRMLTTELAGPGAAAYIAQKTDIVDDVVHRLVTRSRSVAESESEATREQLRTLIDVWTAEAAGKASLQYEDQKNPGNALLIRYSQALEQENFNFSMDQAPWATPESMRDVDAVTPLRQVPLRKESSNE